jgi:phosphoribosylformylglycinamidine synthase
MKFLHDGIPMPTRRARVASSADEKPPVSPSVGSGTIRDRLVRLLSHPNIASKHWIIRQYDHEVQGGSVVKPLTGPLQVGPSDAAVIRPKLDSSKGIALACGLAPHIQDPYAMTFASIDEAIRNVVCVGADPSRVAILDNFCWPSVDDEITMGTLVRACEACRDAALAYCIPFISGKDSLHNQFTDQETGQVIRIPRMLLVSAIGIVEDVHQCVTMDLKDPREGQLCLIGPGSATDAESFARVHRAVAQAIARGLVLSCHDVSDGGLLVAAAEMCIASGFGLSLESMPADQLFAERLATYLTEVHAQATDVLRTMMKQHDVSFQLLGRTKADPIVQVSRVMPDHSRQVDCHVFVEDLTKAWRGTLDW